MLTIGLTGGIGTGKSVVGKLFSLLKVPVYISDTKAKVLMNSNQSIRKQLIQRFGSKIYTFNNELNRQLLAKIIFTDAQALQQVNQIVHPVVRNDFKEWCKKQVNVPYVIQESALLFETGLHRQFDKLITVTASKEERIRRVIARDNISREQIEERMKSQWPEEHKTKHADFVIYNDNKLVIPQVIEIDKALRKFSVND